MWVSLSMPDGTFDASTKWSDSFCPDSQVCALGRVDKNKRWVSSDSRARAQPG